MSRRDQVVVAADGTISVEDVDTFDEAQVSASGILTVGTREAPEVDRLSSDGFTLTAGVGYLNSREVFISPARIIAGTQSGTGSCTITRENTPDGVDAVRFQAAAASGANRSIDILDITTPTAGITYLGVSVYVPDVVEAINLGFSVYVGNDATFSNNRSVAQITNTVVPGYNHLVIPIAAVNAITGQPSLAVVNGAFSGASDIKSMRLRIDSTTSVARDFYVTGIWKGVSGQALCGIGFDDGLTSSLTEGHAYAQTKGIQLTHFLVSSTFGGAGFISASDAEDMRAAGDLLGLHGASRWDEDTGRIATDKAGLEALGLETEHAAYPEGQYGKASANTADVLAALQAAGVRTARTTTVSLIVNFADQPINPLLLPGIPLNNSITLAQAKLWVDRAVATGGGIFFYPHKLGAAADSLTWTVADYQALLDYIAAYRDAGQLQVVTGAGLARRAAA